MGDWKSEISVRLWFVLVVYIFILLELLFFGGGKSVLKKRVYCKFLF